MATGLAAGGDKGVDRVLGALDWFRKAFTNLRLLNSHPGGP